MLSGIVHAKWGLMTRRGSCWLTLGLLASGSAALLEMASVLNPAVGLADDTALIMGYTETPNPLPSYVSEVMSLFVSPSTPEFVGQPTYPGYLPVVQPTEEGADYQQVLTLGASQLNTGINDQIAAGNQVVVFGYSESTSIATQEMINEAALPADQQFDPADLQFILVEDLNNPDGGFLERLPFLAGTDFPATPADTPYDTAIYTVEYSGSSDFPEYPSDLLADENAAAGFVDLHPLLLPGWPTSFDSSSLAGAVLEPTSLGYDGNTEYFMVPTQDLPMLDLTRDLGGNAYADLIQPDMRVIIDEGYDWTSGADLDTPADLTSPTIDTTAADAYLAAGADQGIIAALVDSGILPQADLSDLYPYVPDVAGLDAGALTNDAAALADASSSASALANDLATSSSPLASELSAFLPGFATDLANSFASYLDF
jgi:diacyltrehalose acyltransferase